jgi:cardiolipin synthase
LGQLLNYPWWILALVVLGVLSLASTLITLFSSLGRRPKTVCARDLPCVDSDDFLLAIAGLVNGPLQKGGTATLLNNGDAFFPEILEAVQNAQKNINFLVYIWEPGEASERMFAALTERARAGVEVRVLLDAIGGFRAPRKAMRNLREAGGNIKRFRAFALGKITRFHKRNHRRAIVIDGKVGFTGGAAIADKWMGNAQDPDHWRDCMVKVTGCLAVNLQSAFAEPWAYTCGELLTGDDFFPSFEDDGHSRMRHINLVSSPSSEEHPMGVFFQLSFMAARKKLYVATSYFVPHKQMRKAVADRAKAGVDVRILVPNELTDAKPIRLAGRSYYEELLRAGVRIYEYQPTMMHCKNVVIDGTWSIVGTANMDVRSMELNQENVLGIHDPSFAQQLEESFLADLENSKEIKLPEWENRGTWERFKEGLWVRFAEQY